MRLFRPYLEQIFTYIFQIRLHYRFVEHSQLKFVSGRLSVEESCSLLKERAWEIAESIVQYSGGPCKCLAKNGLAGS